MSTEAQVERTAKWIEEQLDRGLPADAIKTVRATGFDYTDQLYLVPEANRIFGYDGWKSEVIVASHVVKEYTRDVDEWGGEQGARRKTGNKITNHVAVVACTVRLHALGIWHDGQGMDTAEAPIDTFAGNLEKAFKGAETDAMKRAFIKFGDHFGLALYEKVKSERNIEQAETTSGTSAQQRQQSAPAGGGTRDQGEALAQLGSGKGAPADRLSYFRKMLPLVQNADHYEALRQEREALSPAVGKAVREELAAEWKSVAQRVGWQPRESGAQRQHASVNPDWPTVFPNYGRSKGEPISGATIEDLEYYAKGARRSLDDPGKEKHHLKEKMLLAAIEHELAARKSEAA